MFQIAAAAPMCEYEQAGPGGQARGRAQADGDLVAQSRAACLLDKSRVIEEWMTQAFTDVLGVSDQGGGLRPMAELTHEQRACIKRVERHENGIVEVEFVDRQKALEALSKYLGLFDKADEPQRVVIDVWRTA